MLTIHGKNHVVFNILNDFVKDDNGILFFKYLRVNINI